MRLVRPLMLMRHARFLALVARVRANSFKLSKRVRLNRRSAPFSTGPYPSGLSKGHLIYWFAQFWSSQIQANPFEINDFAYY
jgi:hypothetical protein